MHDAVTIEARARQIVAQWSWDGVVPTSSEVALAIARAVREEREACAKVAEKWRATSLMEAHDWHTAMASVASEIRARP